MAAFVTFFLLVSNAFATVQSSPPDITSSTCASPAGFTSCFSTVMGQYQKCGARAGSDSSAQAACTCELAVGEIGCALANCWNVVYGCEYQTLASLLVDSCFAQEIPFFPAPEDAPGGCSCNLGYIRYNVSAVASQFPVCENEATSSFDIPRGAACGCCLAAGFYTSEFSICPGVDPNLEVISQNALVIQASVPQFSLCESLLSQYDCVEELAFPRIGSYTYLTTLPSSTGSATFSTLPGTISAPLSGETFSFTASWSDTSSVTVITAASATSGGSVLASGKPSSTSTNGVRQVRPSLLPIIAYLLSILIMT